VAGQKIKEHDFIEIEYTGMTKDDSVIFDTTSQETAKENDIHNPDMTYGPVVICVGEGQVLKGLDQQLIGKEPGKEYEFEVGAEQAFGKRSAKLIHLINTSKFLKQNIKPVPGLQVTVDNMAGIVKTVTGSRTLVDFNHPLASKDLLYSAKIDRIVTDDKTKAESYLALLLGRKNVDTTLVDGILKIKTKEAMPKEIQENLKSKIRKLIPKIKEVAFTNPA